jgi:hypothetical protein
VAEPHRRGTYQHAGKIHGLTLDEPELGHAIHGLVRWVEWKVEEHCVSSFALTTRSAGARTALSMAHMDEMISTGVGALRARPQPSCLIEGGLDAANADVKRQA